MKQIESIEKRLLDLGFVRPPETEIPATVCLTTLRHDPLLLVVPATHRLARKKSAFLKDLASESFVMYSQSVGTGIQPQIVRLCRESGFEPKVAHEAKEASTIIGMVAAGCGITVLPESFKCIRVKGVCYRPISDPNACTTLMLANRTGESTPLVDSFFRLAIDASH